MLDEDSELTESISDKISQLKILKEELKWKRKESESGKDQNLEQRMEQMQEQVTQIQPINQPTRVANIWLQPMVFLLDPVFL